jgi:hypothetical protein
MTWQCHSKSNKQPRIAALLYSVLANPNCAKGVKHITFEAQGFTDRRPPPIQVNGLGVETLRSAKEFLLQAYIPEGAKWAKALESKDLGATMGLLLSKLHNLQSLSLSVYFLHANHFLSPMLAYAMNPKTAVRAPDLSSFSKLEHVELGVDMSEYDSETFFFLDIKTPDVLPVFYIPHLKRARLVFPAMYTSSDPLPWPAAPPSATGLTELRLQRSTANAETLAKLLDVCPNLTIFEYDLRPCVDHGRSRMDCARLVQALKKYEKTMKHLRICMQPYSRETSVVWDFGAREYQDGVIGDGLKNFSVLETLEISVPVLLGWMVAPAAPLAHVLPPNLRTLTIRDDCWDHKSEGYGETWEWNDVAYTKLFYDFLKHDRWREVCPKLQRINLRLDQTTDDDWEHERREKFKKMCRVKGLECKIRKAVVDQDEVERWGGKEDRREEREVSLQTIFE